MHNGAETTWFSLHKLWELIKIKMKELDKPKKINKKKALSQEWVELWNLFFACGKEYTNLFDSVHSYGCDQAHLDLPKIILNIKSVICQNWIELWCSFFAYSSASAEVTNWYSDLKWLTVTV